ncbi:MAG: hypothetical protein US89_C0002G0107 [Candidatus Peregrinibacteria bacterium GW2011_GWF2_38_29]|nr:MAG: hypothetical protein US89_C0002G0107 [Candidatus Peregrinibacteria bacterium GW2011_GWF2_38_29]
MNAEEKHLEGKKSNEKKPTRFLLIYLEVTVGFEPTNNSFANCPLRPLGYVTKYISKCNNDFIDKTLNIQP